MKRLVFMLFFLLTMTGCKKKDVDPPQANTLPPPVVKAAPAAQPVLSGAMTPVMVESPAMALPEWRLYRETRPTLVVLANHPFLQLFPDQLHREIIGLADDAEADELSQRATSLTADPVMLAPMAVRAALEAGLFAKVVWVFPSRTDKDLLDIKIFRQQLQESGNLTEAEADSLTLQHGHIAGEAAGHPFLAAHPESLPKLDEPIVLHVDLSFFQPYYKGEIKTPIYPMLFGILNDLKTTGWKTLAVTISFSNYEGGIPLASRFVGHDVAELFTKPHLLAEEPPLKWQHRANALYLGNFLKKDEVRQTYLELAAEHPEDASLKFALYDVSRQFKEADNALEYLRQAAKLDNVYALEYLNLADLALEIKRPDKAFAMLQLARAAMPENPFIPLSMAQAAIAARQPEQAKEVLQQLQGLPWSSVYYPEVGNNVKELMQQIKN